MWSLAARKPRRPTVKIWGSVSARYNPSSYAPPDGSTIRRELMHAPAALCGPSIVSIDRQAPRICLATGNRAEIPTRLFLPSRIRHTPHMQINSTQRKLLLFAIIAVLAVGLFPPWVEILHTKEGTKETPLGYGFIALPPSPQNRFAGVTIDLARLAVQAILVLVSIAIGFLLLSDLSQLARKPSERDFQEAPRQRAAGVTTQDKLPQNWDSSEGDRTNTEEATDQEQVPERGNDTRKKAPLARILIGVLIFFVAAFLSQITFDVFDRLVLKRTMGGPPLELLLQNAAKKANKTLPKLIDDYARMDRVVAGPGIRLTYEYTLIDPTVTDLPEEDVRLLETDVIEEVCAKKDFRDWLNQGLQAIYQFKRMDQKLLANFTVTRSKCDRIVP